MPADPTMVEALASGKAFADLSSWRKIGVSGAGSLTWLDGLVFGAIGDLAPGRALRSFMATPSSEARADFTVAVPGGSLLLLQDPRQPLPVLELLAPDAEASGVVLDDRTDELALFAFPGAPFGPTAPGTAFSAPSCAGAGVDVVALMDDHDFVSGLFQKRFRLASEEDLETWRVMEDKRRVAAGET